MLEWYVLSSNSVSDEFGRLSAMVIQESIARKTIYITRST